MLSATAGPTDSSAAAATLLGVAGKDPGSVSAVLASDAADVLAPRRLRL